MPRIFEGLSLVNIVTQQIVKDFGRITGRFEMPGTGGSVVEGATLHWVYGDFKILKRVHINVGPPDDFSYRSGETKTIVNDVVERKFTYSAQPLLKSKRQIKAQASQIILDKYPEWRQHNMTAEAISLLRKGEGNWTTQEQARASQLEAVWESIKNVRERSNILEQALEQSKAVNLKVGSIDGTGGWPTL